MGGITVSGVKHLEKDVLIQISGLQVGNVIDVPGEKITKGVKKLYGQGLFSDIQISASKLIGDKIYLNIHLQERPRLSDVKYKGTSKSETTKIKEKLKLMKGVQVTDYLVSNTQRIVQNYYKEKGYYNT